MVPSSCFPDISDHPRYPLHRARFPSLTEFPDSPSVYSHAYHSPSSDVHPDPTPFHCPSDSPGCTGFDDETCSTTRSFATESIQNDSDVDECTDDASYRMSVQGPKIRFHSRAPWETDDDVPHSEESSKSATFGNKLKGKSSRADNLIRTFTRGSSITSRPSIDSARSVTSFDISPGNYSSSRGALYDLARQSTSTSSFTSVRSQNLTHETNHPKYSHYFTQTHDPISRATVSLDVTVPPAMIFKSSHTLPSCSDISRVSHERSATPSLTTLSQERQSHDQFTHPYANPDLVVVPLTSSPEMMPSPHPISGDMYGSDSGTVTDSASINSTAFSVISTKTSTTSLTSRDTLHGNPRLNNKEISPPMSLRQCDIGYVDRSTRFLSLHPPPAGFEGPLQSNLSPRPPTVTLITLQEAQERERLRSNTVHTTAALSKLPFSNSDHITEVAEDRTVEMDRKMVHTHARSTSSGTWHKIVTLPPGLHQNTEIRDESSVSVTSGRALKHKKSGFMRLFGGRNPEGEKEKSTHPPVPPLSDVCAEGSLQTHGTGKTSKLTLSRTPRSPNSPTLHDSSTNNATSALASTHGASSGRDGADGRGSSRRRQPPSLSIVTKSFDHGIPISLSGERLPMGVNFTSQPLLTVPQSAPPGNSDFPGLKLRPVSTSFSSHFTDMVVGAVEEPQHEVHTPSSAASSNTVLSPITPISTRRGDGALTAVEAPGEAYSTVKELQEQLVSTKALQQQLWELRGQIRDLTSELENHRAADDRGYCEVCGRGPRKRYASPLDEQQPKKVGVVNRPRARTGDTGRFTSGN